MANLTAQTLQSPVLEDAALLVIQSKLQSGLSWLATAYGRAHRLTERAENGQQVYFPAVYANSTDGTEYIKLFPDSEKGNFSFFDLKDDQQFLDLATKSPKKNIYRFGADLVFWFDLRTVYPSPADWTGYGIANVVKQVSDLLQTAQMPGINIELKGYKYDPNNVYKGYDAKPFQAQFAMKPFGCFRLECSITHKTQC